MSYDGKNNLNLPHFKETIPPNVKSLMHTVFGQVEQGLAIVDTSGEIIYSNKNFFDHFSLNSDDTFPLSLKTIFEKSISQTSNRAIDLKKLFDVRLGDKKKLRVKTSEGKVLNLFIGKLAGVGENHYYLLETTPHHDVLDQSDSSAFNIIQSLQSLIAEAPFAVEIYDKNGTLIRVNSAWERMWNVKAKDFINKFNLHKEYRETGLYNYIERAFAGETVKIPEMMLSRKFAEHHSEKKWIRQRALPLKNNLGTVEQVIFSQEDIAHLNQSERGLHFSEHEFRVIWEKSPLGMRLTDEQGIIHRVNPAFCQLVEMSEKELLGKHLSVAYKEDDREHILKMHQKRFRERTVKTHFETEIQLWNGKKLWLEVSNSFFTQVNGETLLLGIFRDISLRKAYEIALHRERQYFESLFQNSPEAIVLADSHGKIKRINSSFSRLFDFQQEEILGKSVDEIIIPKNEKDRGQAIAPKTLHGEVVSAEAKRTKKSGELIDVSILASKVNPSSENSDTYLIYRDITERKKSELALQTLLKEKDILLKEVHHRIKNNFQVISSLLYLQAKNVSDEKARQIFRDSQNRIRSMALVHEKLYQSQDLSSINLKEYLISLVESLYRSLQSGQQKIDVKMDFEAINLSIDHAIPCGLIVNELFTNAMKYAFPKNFQGKPEIRIACKMSDDNKIKLSFSDNGIGLPEDFSFETSRSLGMRLVHSLVQNQLEGAIEINRKRGTQLNMIFAL